VTSSAATGTDPQPLLIVANCTGRPRDTAHAEELLAGLAAQTEPRWHLLIVAPLEDPRLLAALDTQPASIRARVELSVGTRTPSRTRSSTRERVVTLRIDDVPLTRFVEVAARGRDLGVAEQPVRECIWPSGTAGWSPIGPPRAVGPRGVRGLLRRREPEIVLLRRAWTS
jgi:hypothetical protein